MSSHHLLESSLNKIYIIRNLAKHRKQWDIFRLASRAVRELEDLKGETLDLDTWLANHEGLLNYPADEADTHDGDTDTEDGKDDESDGG